MQRSYRVILARREHWGDEMGDVITVRSCLEDTRKYQCPSMG